MITDSVSNYRDTMNAAYSPMASPGGLNARSAMNNKSNFQKELERKTDFLESVDISNGGYHSNVQNNVNSDQPLYQKKDDSSMRVRKDDEPRAVDNKTDNKTDGRADNKTDNKGDNKTDNKNNNATKDGKVDKNDPQGKNNGSENGEGNVDGNVDGKGDGKGDGETKNAEQKELTGKNAQQAATKAGKAGSAQKIAGKTTKVSDFKEFIKQNMENAEAMDNVKKEVKATQAQSHKIKNQTGQTVKNVDPAAEKNPTANIEKIDEMKHLEEMTAEKTGTAEAEKKGEKTAASFLSQLKSKEVDAKAEPQAINMGNVDGKDSKQATEMKIKKLLGQNNTQQYQALKDKILNSVENSIKMMVSEGDKQVSIKLQPPELGRVEVELVIKDNQVNAKIHTENIAVKEVVMSNLELLKSNIENAGISVNKFDVDVGGFKNQFDQHFANNSGDSNGGTGTGNGKGDGQQGGRGPLKEKDWLPDKVLSQKALNVFLGSAVNYLV